MAVSYNKQREIIDFLEESGMDPKFIGADFKYSSDAIIHLTVNNGEFGRPWGFENWEEDKQDKWEIGTNRIKRRIKEVFGPFIAEGEAPNVYLNGVAEVNGTTLKASWYGAFKCEVTQIKVTERDEAEIRIEIQNTMSSMQRLASQFVNCLFQLPLVEEKKLYDCKPS